MSKQLLVRNVPSDICLWIDQKRDQHNMSQQEVVLSVLDKAVAADMALQLPLFSVQPQVIEKTVPQSLPFTFIDLFAGIGGFRSALEKLGGKCRFSCEWDKYSQKTYKAWYGDTPHADIRDISIPDIPSHDVLAAGFPCQPFSLAGVSKRQSLGMAHGFKCVTQGNLFFQLATIIEAKRPPVLFLENVKNLKSHDKRRTWQVIHERLSDLNYWIFDKVIDAAAWVPQHRERVYIVCFDKKRFPECPPFEYPQPPAHNKPRLADILEPDPDPKYTLTPHLWNYLQRYAEGHRAKGNGFGFGLGNPEGIARTLSARYHKDGAEILIPQGDQKPPRRLTPVECCRLMGFDEKKIVVSDMQAYRQFGNAVVPKVVEAVGREILKVMFWKLSQEGGLFQSADAPPARRKLSA
jgi:DNA (cytosine-5)-methyltransferase 1